MSSFPHMSYVEQLLHTLNKYPRTQVSTQHFSLVVVVVGALRLYIIYVQF